MDQIEVLVGRVGKPHGLRGEVTVEVRTDEPERRFEVGRTLRTEAAQGGNSQGPPPGRLRVARSRWHQSTLLITFDEVTDRNAAEALRGTRLLADVPAEASPEDPEEFYDHQLIGLEVVNTDGARLGEVSSVQHGAAQDLLQVRADDGREALVPFVAALVREIDVEAGRVTVADRPGLVSPFPAD